MSDIFSLLKDAADVLKDVRKSAIFFRLQFYAEEFITYEEKNMRFYGSLVDLETEKEFLPREHFDDLLFTKDELMDVMLDPKTECKIKELFSTIPGVYITALATSAMPRYKKLGSTVSITLRFFSEEAINSDNYRVIVTVDNSYFKGEEGTAPATKIQLFRTIGNPTSAFGEDTLPVVFTKKYGSLRNYIKDHQPKLYNEYIRKLKKKIAETEADITNYKGHLEMFQKKYNELSDDVRLRIEIDDMFDKPEEGLL